MNRSFENIFEKYNITYKLPKKRKKLIKQQTPSNVLNKSYQSLFTNRSENSNVNKTTYSLNQSFNNDLYINTSTKRKYCSPTRYNTLNLIQVDRSNKNINCSGTETSKLNESLRKSAGDLTLKENIPLQQKEKNNTLLSNIECKRKSLSYSFNLGKRSQNNKNRIQSTYKQLITTVIPRNRNLSSSFKAHNTLNETLNCFENSSPELSQIIENPTPPQEASNNTNTELDLLIELIKREDKENSRQEKIKKNDILCTTKSCLKGGYEELFERALKRETVRGNFLKHDRKFGLRIGKLLTVIELDTFYDVTLAVVKSENLSKHFGIIVAPAIVSQLKIGSQVEAFFDENCLPYTVQYNNELIEVYLEPYKLLVV